MHAAGRLLPAACCYLLRTMVGQVMDFQHRVVREVKQLRICDKTCKYITLVLLKNGHAANLHWPPFVMVMDL